VANQGGITVLQLRNANPVNDKDQELGSGVDIAALRRPASGQTLEREDLADDPVRQFQTWLQDACESESLDPNAMSIATVDAEGRPDTRTVLLKYYDAKGFVFFTNLSSAKAAQIADNDNVALLFFWPTLGRQIRIRGTAKKISTAETLRYFATRPRGSQIGAWVSAQSSVISSRSLLEAKYAEIKQKFADHEVPLPSFWGGYRVTATEYEFWQSRTNRLHDRFRYTMRDERWHVHRLAP
jgi:pyridoxamine 5'-phosphate oxidase